MWRIDRQLPIKTLKEKSKFPKLSIFFLELLYNTYPKANSVDE